MVSSKDDRGAADRKIRGHLIGGLRGLGVLAGTWVLLGLVALIAGVLPEFRIPLGPGEPRDADGHGDAGPAGTVTTAADGGEVAATATTAVGTGPIDAGGPTEEMTAPIQRALSRYRLCGGDATRPFVSAVNVIGDGRPELVIGCAGGHRLIAAAPRSRAGARTLEPAVVATFVAAAVGPETRLQAGGVAVGDVNGDGLGDLLLSGARVSATAGTTQGYLHLARMTASGAFDTPTALAAIAGGAVAAVELDGRPGREVVALNLGNPLASRPGEVWTFAGGAAPQRAALLRADVRSRSLATGDWDHDGSVDIAVLSGEATRLDVHFGDGLGRFPRSARLSLPDGDALIAGDLDDDGRDDLLVRGDRLVLLRQPAPPEPDPDPNPDPGRPPAPRQPAGTSLGTLANTVLEVPPLEDCVMVDFDHDGKTDLVGTGDARLLWLRRTEGLGFDEQTLVTFEAQVFAPIALTVADFDGDGKLDAAVLGHGPLPNDPWVLILIGDASGQAAAVLTAEPEPLPDAPLTLSYSLL